MYALIRSFWCQLTWYSRRISVPFTHRLPQRRCTVSPLSTQLWIETVSLFRHSHPPVVLLTPRVLTKISWHVYHVYSAFIAPRSGCDTAVTLFQDVSSAWNRHRCHTLAICRSAARAQGLKIFSSESCVYGCVCARRPVCTRACLRDRGGGAGIWSRRAFISLWVGSLWGPSQKLSISSIVLFPSLASLLSHVELQKASYPPPHTHPHPYPSSSLISHPFPPCSNVREAYNPVRLFWKYFTTLQCSHHKLEFRQRTGAGKLRLWTSFGLKQIS